MLSNAELKKIGIKLDEFAERVQSIENAGDKEELYNSLWNSLDEAGATILEILGEEE